MRYVKAEDLFETSFLSQLRFSPDGQRAVFTVTSCDTEKNAYRADLWLWENGETRALTSAGDAKSAQWLDGHTLLFSAVRREEDRKAKKERKALTVWQSLDLRGGEAREFLRAPVNAGGLKSLGGGCYAALCKYDRNGDEEPDYEVFEEIPFWGNGLGFTSAKRNRLCLIRQETQEFVTGEYEQVGAWDAQNGRLLFAAHEFRGMDVTTNGVYLWENGARKTLLTEGKWAVQWVGFLGETPVALMSDMIPYGQSQNAYFYELDGEQPRMLSGLDEAPGGTLIGDMAYGGGDSIVCDGDALWYVAVDGTDTALRRVTGAGTETVLVTPGAIEALAVRNGRILCVATVGERLGELYEVKDGALCRLTSFNEELYTARTLPAPVKLSAMNGDTRIDGFVLPPANYEEGKCYPAIMDIHGGPRAAYGAQYFHEMQVWSAAGYYVFFCNPRGGEGRGNEFADLRGQFGKIDYDDLMAFTDAVLKAYPQIDQRHIGVTGGSYGGFMTNWMIGHTDRFAAAASQRSIANWVTKYLCTDIGYSYNGEQLQADPWNGVEKMWWHSPVKYADRVKTPTLFIHSDEDYRCWLAEGLQMFTALRCHGVETRLCLFHGENHGLSRGGKPKHRVRRIREITEWMDKYLK